MTASNTAMIESVVQGFAERFGDSDGVVVAMAPGRVNLIGEYTDFNDGFVFPMTVDRGVYLAIRPRTDRQVWVASIRYEELIEYELDEFEAPKPGSWSSYVLGVVEELRLRGLLNHGFEAVVDGNLNLGAGLSSSAALEVATAVSLQQITGYEMDRVDMVKLCQHVEHNYANVLCGIMDQFACGIGRSGHALLLDCRSLDYENVPVELGDYRVVIVSSEVKRFLASSAYNTRRAECQEAVEHFSQYDDSIRALRDVSADLFEAQGVGLTPVVRRRCGHVVSENQRALDAAAALKLGNLEVFGALMIESHRSLRDDFEVSCPELDLLVKLANSTDGVLGSRMTGAGFGGCTVSIVHRDAVMPLTDKLNSNYTARFNLTPGVFVLKRNLEAGPVSRV
jgi:galactokinase